MRTVIGLLPSKQDVTQEIQQLESAGFARNNIRLVTNSGSIKKLFGCDPNRIVAKFASWGVLLGIAVYGVFILVAIWCDYAIYPINQLVAFEIVLVGIIVGAVIGGFIGIFYGMAESEKDIHLYTQGINMGDKVFVMQTERGNVEKAKETLYEIGCLGVRAFPQ